MGTVQTVVTLGQALRLRLEQDYIWGVRIRVRCGTSIGPEVFSLIQTCKIAASVWLGPIYTIMFWSEPDHSLKNLCFESNPSQYGAESFESKPECYLA